jgi:lysophospholipase
MAMVENGRNRVLVLYTGGTIGMMQVQGQGYMPKEGYLTQQMRVVAPDLMQTVTTIDYAPLLDSCKISHEDWAKIASDIETNYLDFDAFVVVHGTDTMAYTASGLSFMLENLGKPVIITGSQIPLCELRNDAASNLIGALELAVYHRIPEVCVYFCNKLFRGCRVRKVDSSNLKAFDSPNHQPLAELDCQCVIHWDRVWRASTTETLKVNKSLSQNIVVLSFFPGITAGIVRGILSTPGLQGVVLKSFGAGNVDTNDEEMLQELTDAHKRGIVIVNLTQCDRGQVVAIYETGITLLKCGVIAGNDMTTESALAKLSVLLGNNQLSQKQVEAEMVKNLRGEFTEPSDRISLENNEFLRAVQDTLRISSESDRSALAVSLNPVLACAYASTGDIQGLSTLDTNCCDYDKRTPLHVSAAIGNVEVCDYLLSRGADPNAVDVHGHTPIKDAVAAGHLNVSRILYKAGSRLATDAGQLCEAARNNEMDLLKTLIEFGMNPSTGDYDGRTALHLAMAEGHTALAMWLIKEHPETAKQVDRWGAVAGSSQQQQ